MERLHERVRPANGVMVGWRFGVALALVAAVTTAAAESVTVSYLEGQNPVAPDAITAHGPDLFGDRLNLFSGGLEFEHTDLSLPGNSALPVALVRKHTPGRAHEVRGQFGDWDLEVPRISGTFSMVGGWISGTGGTDRCSGQLMPPAEPRFPAAAMASGLLTVVPASSTSKVTGPAADGLPQAPQLSDLSGASFIASDYWRGIYLSVPGQGSQEILQRSVDYSSAPTDGATYPLVTRNNWQLSCLPAVLNAPGQGFMAVSPQGVRYRFDWMASRTQTSVRKSPFALARLDMFLMATQVTDRFGNWVRYSYDASNPLLLTRIEASDGRVVTISNAGGRAVSASDGTRTYQYSYGSLGELASVLQPDGSRWSFDLTPMVSAYLSNMGESATCEHPGDFGGEFLTGRMTHPSGAQGAFTTEFLLFGRTGVERVCKYIPQTTTTIGAVWPKFVASQALVGKQISGPGLPNLTWAYLYQAGGGWSTCTTKACTDPRWVTVTEPSGVKTRHTFGSKWRVNEGQLQKMEEGWNGTTALKTTAYRYRSATGQVFPDQFGSSPQRDSDWLAQRNRPQDQRIVTLQRATFTWEADATSAGFDRLARPLKVRRFSSLGDTRTDATAYADHVGLWVLGQPVSLKELTSNLVEHQHEYDPSTALRTKTWSFGALVKSYAYNADGTLNTVFDAAGRPTRLAGHKRGKPQQVTHPDGAVESQVINNLGNADSRTNAVGSLTRFFYDAMGRVTLIEPPAGDAAAYHPTVQVFEPVGSPEFGLAGGHWRQTVSTGNARTVRFFDALWRERLELRYDEANAAGTATYEETRYDLGGRKAFASYPQRSFSGLDVARPGIWTEYDAIGRVTKTSASSELSALSITTTTYSSAAYMREVVSPNGAKTTTAFQAFDEPSEDSIDKITAPEGVTVTLTRDVFGKATRITRSGGSASAIRRYVYDNEQRLCKTIEPESGATVQAYDLAGNVAWRASGLALSSTASCNQTSVPAGRKVNFAYDARDRLVSTTYGDGSTPVTRSYTLDGLPQTINTDLFGWTLSYNKARLLVSESLSSPLGSYSFGYGIDSHRHVASMAYPGGPTLSYSPDAFGRPTRVSGYASAISYHPNGQVAGYTAANGVAYSLTQNTRGLPLTMRHAGVVQDQYTYDKNGNVTAITDQQEGLSSRTMAYDGLDRLIVANGTWGAGAYGYDALDNLISSRVGARVLTHTYDTATNRLTGVSGSVNASVAYDANGNVVSRAGQAFTFDIGNRLTVAANIANYYYDGHGRRAGLQTAAGRTVLRIYGQSGRLLLTQDTGSGATGGTTRHIHLGDKVIAEHHSASGARWLHVDGLGSPVAVTGPTGAILERTRYEPYGQTAAGVNRDGIGFAGHVNDLDTGLVYMQQRYYDPYAGRFLSVDPVTTDAKTGGHFNRYTYADNSPYRYTDPDGRSPKLLVDLGLNVALNVLTTGELGLASAAKETLVGALNPAKTLQTAIKLGDAAKDLAKSTKTFQTYTKTHPETGAVYCGRTSGCGTPLENVANRDSSHHVNKEGYGPAVLDKSSTNSAAIRGREQQNIDANGGARSSGGTSGNAINGIAPSNQKGDAYIKAAEKEFGPR